MTDDCAHPSSTWLTLCCDTPYVEDALKHHELHIGLCSQCGNWADIERVCDECKETL